MIRFENLCAGYADIEVLHRVHMTVPEGKLTALIGPNGCGKSTLMKVAAGMIHPASGGVFLNEICLNDLTDRARAKHLAYMPQSRPAPEISVAQLVSHGRYPHLAWGRSLTNADSEIVRQAMVQANVLDYAQRRVDQLSGGERQRAYLAMMLAQQTPVMLLDEPTTYLDLRAQFDMMDRLQALARQGHTLLAVLHDISLALEYCDHILLMDAGAVVAAGAPQDVFDSGAIQSTFQIASTRFGPYYHFHPGR